MSRIEQMTVAKICLLINTNLASADKQRLKLKWGFTKEGKVYGRILNRWGQCLQEKFYSGSHVIVHIGELHFDFSIGLENIKNTRRFRIQHKWNERRRKRENQGRPTFEEQREIIRRQAFDEKGTKSPFPYDDYL